MLLYSWSKILRHSKTMGDALQLLRALDNPSALRTKYHKQAILKDKLDLSGNNFLLNPDKVLFQVNIPAEHVIQYISLASKRNLAEYILDGRKTLDIRLAKTVPKNNPLITVKNNIISFAYE